MSTHVDKRNMLDLTRPIQTTGGEPARILAGDIAGGYPLAVAIANSDGSGERICRSTLSGKTWCSEQLQNIPIKREGWINLYRCPNYCVPGGVDGIQTFSSTVYSSRKYAVEKINEGCGFTVTAHIEWEE